MTIVTRAVLGALQALAWLALVLMALMATLPAETTLRCIGQ